MSETRSLSDISQLFYDDYKKLLQHGYDNSKNYYHFYLGGDGVIVREHTEVDVICHTWSRNIEPEDHDRLFSKNPVDLSFLRSERISELIKVSRFNKMPLRKGVEAITVASFIMEFLKQNFETTADRWIDPFLRTFIEYYYRITGDVNTTCNHLGVVTYK